MPKDLCEIIKNNNLSEQEKLEALKVALAEGADLNKPDAKGQYPLQLAFNKHYPSRLIIKFLLDQGASFLHEDLNTFKPLHRAVAEGWLDIIKLLFDKRLYLFSWYAKEIHTQDIGLQTDTSFTDYYVGESELTPVSLAIQTCKAEILDFILSYEPVMQEEFNKHGLKMTPILQQTYAHCVREDTEHDAPILKYRLYPIHLLGIFEGGRPYEFKARGINIDDWVKTLEMLLEHGCDIDQCTKDEYQDSLLHLLCKNPTRYYWHPKEAIKVAIEYGADPYQKNRQGQTPLVTCYKNFDELARFLCEQGYDLNRVWQPKNALPEDINFEVVLNYFPQYYVNVYQNSNISDANLGSILQCTVNEDRNELSPEEWADHLNRLAAYLMTKPQYIDADSRKLIAKAFSTVIETMLAKEKFEAQHLSALKVVLENRTYVPKDLVSSITDYYLKIYQKFFTQLPSLKILALDSLLTHAHDFAEDTEIVSNQMNVIKNIFESAPIKTIKAQNGFYHLSFFCAQPSNSSGEEDSNDSLSHSDDSFFAYTGNKRSFLEVKGEVSEEPSPKRHKS